jgi:integrase
MRLPTAKLVIRAEKKNSSGEAPIYLRLTLDRKSRFVSTGFGVQPSLWNSNNQTIRKTHPRAKKLNENLKWIKDDAQDKAVELVKRLQGGFTLDHLLAELRGQDSKDVFQYGSIYRQRLLDREQLWESKKAGVVLSKLSTFCKSASLPFSRVDTPFLYRFDGYMRKSLGNKPNTIAKNMDVLGRLMKSAVSDGVWKQTSNPFAGYSIKRESTIKPKLTIEQIHSIRDLDLPVDTEEWHARNYFMFSFYLAGIRFGDLCRLTWDKLAQGRLEYRMGKTGTPKSVRLVPQAMEILKLYQSSEEKPSQFVFPILDGRHANMSANDIRRAISSKNSRMNTVLKKIAELAGVPLRLSFHMSRHSFADYARKRGMSIYDISKALGHKNLQVTERYLKEFDEESVDQAMGDLFSGC